LVQLNPLHRHSGWFVCLLLAALLGGCSSSPVTPGTPPAASPDVVQPAPPEAVPVQPQVPRAAKPDTDSATLALLQQSQRAQSAGSMIEAIAYTERAIRISPRQADLWNRLASLELANGQPGSAIQYANKALTLAGERTDWQRQSWLIIADAKDAQGDHAGAVAIRERWQTYRG